VSSEWRDNLTNRIQEICSSRQLPPREARERVWNTGSPVKYGRSGNPTLSSSSMTAWLHTLHVVCNHVSFHVLYACSPSPYRNHWASGLQSCREVGLSSDHTPVRSEVAPLTTLHYVCLGVCSLAVITPSVLHTVSGWYPSGAWLTAAADFLVYSPVTSQPRDAWPCDKLTCSRASFVSYITEADHNAYANLYPRSNTKSWRILPTQGRAKLH